MHQRNPAQRLVPLPWPWPCLLPFGLFGVGWFGDLVVTSPGIKSFVVILVFLSLIVFNLKSPNSEVNAAEVPTACVDPSITGSKVLSWYRFSAFEDLRTSFAIAG